MDSLIDSVNEIWKMLQRNQDCPEMYSMTRDLIWGLYSADTSDSTESRLYYNMKNISEDSPDEEDKWDPWLTAPIASAIQDVNQLYSYVRGNAGGYSKDSRQNVGFPASQKHVMPAAVWLDRQGAFLVQMQQALVDVTRSHQELFFNRQYHRELYDAGDGFKDVADFLVNGS